jgi:hypothetical protein
VAHDETVVDMLLGFYRTNVWSGLQTPQPISGVDGAARAAAAIEDLLSTRPARYA